MKKLVKRIRKSITPNTALVILTVTLVGSLLFLGQIAVAHNETRPGCQKTETGGGTFDIGGVNVTFTETPVGSGTVVWNVEPGISGTVDLYGGGNGATYDYSAGTGVTPLNSGGQIPALSHVHLCLVYTTPSPSPTPDVQVSPEPSPSPTPSEEPSPSPSPSTEPSPTPTPDVQASPDPSPSPSEEPSPTPTPVVQASPDPSPSPSEEPSPSPTPVVQASPDPSPSADSTPGVQASPDPSASADPGISAVSDPSDPGTTNSASNGGGVAPTSFADTGALNTALPGLFSLVLGAYSLRRWRQMRG